MIAPYRLPHKTFGKFEIHTLEPRIVLDAASADALYFNFAEILNPNNFMNIDTITASDDVFEIIEDTEITPPASYNHTNLLHFEPYGTSTITSSTLIFSEDADEAIFFHLLGFYTSDVLDFMHDAEKTNDVLSTEERYLLTSEQIQNCNYILAVVQYRGDFSKNSLHLSNTTPSEVLFMRDLMYNIHILNSFSLLEIQRN